MRIIFMLAFTVGLVFCYVRLVQDQDQTKLSPVHQESGIIPIADTESTDR